MTRQSISHGRVMYLDVGHGLLRCARNDRAILVHNACREQGLADGLIITPSHNSLEDGGIKYNTPDGGLEWIHYLVPVGSGGFSPKNALLYREPK